jgi:CDP-diacylglycerol--glycerol-3-phosphate 3-phosphatidyltransferase
MELTWANRITILRILLIAPFISCLLNINDPEFTDHTRFVIRWSAVAIFIAMAVSDGLDGLLARRNGQITRLGAFLDPTADKLLITSASILLATRHSGVDGLLLPPTVVVFIIGKDVFLFIGFLIVFFLTGKLRVVPVLAGKVSTALQLIMVAAILISPEVVSVFSGWAYFVRFLWWAAAGAALVATLVYIRIGAKFIEQYEQTSNGPHPQKQ